MSKDKPIERLVDIQHRREEWEVRNYGMKIGDCVAPLLLEIGIETTRRIKADAKRKGGQGKTVLYRESNYLSEYALNRYLTNKKHTWVGFGSLARPDYKIWRDGEVITIGLRSVRHRTLMAKKANPAIYYPARRLSDPERLLDDYMIGASVMSYATGGSVVAYWGAIERSRLVTIMLKLWGDKTIPTSGNARVDIPLGEFDPQLMMDLLGKADKGRRRY